MTLIFSGLCESQDKELIKLIKKSIFVLNNGINDPTHPNISNWIECENCTQKIGNFIIKNESKNLIVWLWSDLFDNHNIIGEMCIPSNAKSKDDVVLKISNLTNINEFIVSELLKESDNF